MILPILIAAIVSFIVGALWYGPVFGKCWMKMMGYTRESMRAMAMTPAKAMLLGFLSQVVFASVLARAIFSFAFDFPSALSLAFWIWIGFYVPVTLGGYLWEGKSLKLVAFNMAYQLVGLLATASAVVAALSLGLYA
jgi:hypothetical protein